MANPVRTIEASALRDLAEIDRLRLMLADGVNERERLRAALQSAVDDVPGWEHRARTLLAEQ